MMIASWLEPSCYIGMQSGMAMECISSQPCLLLNWGQRCKPLKEPSMEDACGGLRLLQRSNRPKFSQAAAVIDGP